MIRFIVSAAAFISLFTFSARGEESIQQWTWFAENPRLFQTPRADPREAQMRTAFMRASNGKSFFDMSLGGDLGIFKVQNRDSAFSLSARATVATRFEYFSKSFDMQNADYIGGVAASRRAGAHSMELLLYHCSSHLGDDLMEQGRPAINLSYESARFLYAYSANPQLRVYSGMEFRFRGEPVEIRTKTAFILGAEWQPFAFAPEWFTALDLRMREEDSFSPRTSLMVGYLLGSPDILRRQWLYVAVYNGNSSMGQFFRDREFSVSFGIGFNPS